MEAIVALTGRNVEVMARSRASSDVNGAFLEQAFATSSRANSDVNGLFLERAFAISLLVFKGLSQSKLGSGLSGS